MFLAWNEIVHAKLRYGLIIGIMFLVAYLVFFLTGLAYGLSQDYRMAIDKWQADGIVLSKDANTNLNMSTLSVDALDQIEAEEKAVFAQMAGILKIDGQKNDQADVSFFGIDSASFLAPTITAGRMIEKAGETVADSSLKAEQDVEIGDVVTVTGSEEKLTIVGFTEGARYSVSPILYVSIEDFQKLRYEQERPGDQARINGIVVRAKAGDIDQVQVKDKELAVYQMQEFINALPGYHAQVLTFSFMIGFLVVIAAVVIGIFIYVLTLQKSSIFGVMKAQGIASSYIALSVILQTFVLAIFGVSLGLLGTVGTALLLPTAVPFKINWLFFAGISVAMLIVAVAGALFSVRTIVKIDPLKAIG